jgi:cytochrome c oxidase assembly protein subunit 15
MAIGILLAVQLSLGIANVVMQLPLPVAVAHNGGAALLLLALVTLNHLLRPETAT